MNEGREYVERRMPIQDECVKFIDAKLANLSQRIDHTEERITGIDSRISRYLDIIHPDMLTRISRIEQWAELVNEQIKVYHIETRDQIVALHETIKDHVENDKAALRNVLIAVITVLITVIGVYFIKV